MNQKLLDLLQQIKLPDVAITPQGQTSKQFLDLGKNSFYAAIDHIYKLPYAPPSQPYNYNLVVPEQRGTCSTRHALLTTLAKELELPLNLGLGIYNLTPERFPVLTPILKKYKIPYIPETHNFLVYHGKFLDITFPGDAKILAADDVIEPAIISPDQITDYKAKLYREYLDRWYAQNDFSFTMDQLNAAHKECLAKLMEQYS